jgi:hypothetical protein
MQTLLVQNIGCLDSSIAPIIQSESNLDKDNAGNMYLCNLPLLSLLAQVEIYFCR